MECILFPSTILAAKVNTIIRHTLVAPGYACDDVCSFAAGVPIKNGANWLHA